MLNSIYEYIFGLAAYQLEQHWNMFMWPHRFEEGKNRIGWRITFSLDYKKKISRSFVS